MATARLPKTVDYLTPFVRVLAHAEQADQLGETGEVGLLCELLRSRIKGLQRDRARMKLERDREELSEFVNSHPNHPAQFIVAFMLQSDDLVDFLRSKASERVPMAMLDQVGIPRERAVKGVIRIDVPKKFRVRYDGPTGVCVESDGVFVVVDRLKVRSMETLVHKFGTEFDVQRVDLGEVAGYRVTRDGQTRYFLERSGDRFLIVVVDGDASKFEPHLATLRIE